MLVSMFTVVGVALLARLWLHVALAWALVAPAAVVMIGGAAMVLVPNIQVGAPVAPAAPARCPEEADPTPPPTPTLPLYSLPSFLVGAFFPSFGAFAHTVAPNGMLVPVLLVGPLLPLLPPLMVPLQHGGSSSSSSSSSGLEILPSLSPLPLTPAHPNPSAAPPPLPPCTNGVLEQAW